MRPGVRTSAVRTCAASARRRMRRAAISRRGRLLAPRQHFVKRDVVRGLLELDRGRLGEEARLVDERVDARLHQVRADVEEQQQPAQQKEHDDQQDRDEADEDVRERQLAPDTPEKTVLHRLRSTVYGLQSRIYRTQDRRPMTGDLVRFRHREAARHRAVQHHLHPRRSGPRPVDRRHHHPYLSDVHVRPGGARQAQGLRVRADAESDAVGLEANLAAIENGKAAFALRLGHGGRRRRDDAARIRRPRRRHRQHLRRHLSAVRARAAEVPARFHLRRLVEDAEHLRRRSDRRRRCSSSRRRPIRRCA